MIVLFLMLSALTGSVLVFYKEIDRALNPAIFQVTKPNNSAVLMEPLALYDRVQQQKLSYQFNRLRLDINAANNVKMPFTDSEKQTKHSDFTELYANPYTGDIVAYRNPTSLTINNVMPILFDFHRNLLLGEIGKLILGITALIWTLNCFIGLYLTLPRKAQWDKFIQVWKQKWRIQFDGRFVKLNFQLHQAFGLWFWLFLLIMAWSSVSFNLPTVYAAITAPFFKTDPYPSNLTAADLTKPTVPMSQALSKVKEAMALEEKNHDFTVQQYRYISLNEATKVLLVRAKTSMDLNDNGSTRIMLDATNGELIGRYYPTGQTVGNTISSWLYALHMGTVGGLAYRLFLFSVGIVVFILGFTGTYLWLRRFNKKRRT